MMKLEFKELLEKSGKPTHPIAKTISLQQRARITLILEIKVTPVPNKDKMSSMLLTVITHAPWSSSLTGSRGGRKSAVVGDMAIEKNQRH